MSYMVSNNLWIVLNWEKSRLNLLRLQRRIFKSILVGDVRKCLQIQKLLIISNSARLLSIRIVSLKSINKFFKDQKFYNKISFSFVEKIKLNKFLFLYCFNWKPQKSVNFLFSVSDIVWQYLVKFAFEPSQECLFSPHSFGFRSNFSVFMLQKLLFLNFDFKSLGFQKRLFLIYIKGPFSINKFNFFFRKLIIPKTFKITIFKFLKFGFKLDFPSNIFEIESFSCFLSNVFFHGFEKKFNIFRFGSYFLSRIDKIYILLY